MAVLEIHYTARCKHCANLKRYRKGRRVLHKCGVSGDSVTLKDKTCDKFRL